MPDKTTQIKFTIESEIVIAFKAKCVSENVSMTSVIRQWMQGRQIVKELKMKTYTRPDRRKAVKEIIGLLNNIMESESDYRESIPEQFTQRNEDADLTCEQLAEAISSLGEAY